MRPRRRPSTADVGWRTGVFGSALVHRRRRGFSKSSDLKSIPVPTLIVPGGRDDTVPLAASGQRTAAALPHATLKVYEDAPHGLHVTGKDRLHADLAAFAALA